MNLPAEMAELVHRGGPVVYVLIVLSTALYAWCFRLLLALRRLRRAGRDVNVPLAEVRHAQARLEESFGHQRRLVGAMIAAAPLLGLLGTVSGMVHTFDALGQRAGRRSMEALAGGISEVLVATESGLAVALPALLLLFLAQRELHRHLQTTARPVGSEGRS